MNWKSNYKLPLSFIIFFVLMFFLIGEQLPSLPLYLFGQAQDHENKLHILDLAPPDALHRPIAYLIIATTNWVFLRNFSWPLVYGITGILWEIDQWFLNPPGNRPQYSGLLGLLFTGTGIFLFWGILTLAPYFIYRWIDKKWGGKGIRNAILIVFFINLMLFCFFAFQIYVLHNSYRYMQEKSSQQGMSANDKRNTQCQKDNPNNPPDCPRRK